MTAALLPLRGARSLRSRVPRGADIGGGVDFAIIRFKVPGFDDLTMLPRVIAVVFLGLLVANRYFFPPIATGSELRTFTEVFSVALAAGCFALPWMGRRLEEAARRQVSTRPISRQQDCLQTLAISESLTKESRIDLAWASSVLLRFTNADGLLVWREAASGGEVICTRGVLRQLPGFDRGTAAVLAAASAAWQPTFPRLDGFCATRQGLEAFPQGSLPTKVLPKDTESVVAKPLCGGGLLVLWSALPRAFDRGADRLWVARVAAKVNAALHLGAGDVPSSAERCFEADMPILDAGIASASGAESRDPFARFDQEIRLSPSVVGILALGVLGWNRVALLGTTGVGIDTAQSRADLVGGTLAATLVLQGFVWISETPATPEIEDTASWTGVETLVKVDRRVGDSVAASELIWTWESLRACTRACSMVVFWRGKCLMQGGLFRRLDAGGVAPTPGPLCEEVLNNGKGRYLAQLTNYPAKEHFLEFLPERTQGLVLTPLCPARNAPAAGVIVLGVDSVRGIGKVDQAWIGALAEKLGVALGEAL